ncbi:MAG: glycerophosphodiester phosphodiesterase [Polyangiales bacterium]
MYSRSARPLLFAHRGAAAEEPENTLPSFRRALEVGADVLEMDVHMTADGQVVVSHDETGGRMAGVARAIRRTTLENVLRWDVGWGFLGEARDRPFAGRGYRIPTLEEVIREFDGVPLNVDAKQQSPPMIEPLVNLVRRLGAESRVRIASFHEQTLRAVRRLGYQGETGLAPAELRRLVVLPSPLLRWAGLRGQAAQVPTHASGFTLATPSFIEKCHRVGLRVDFFTINDAAVASRLLDMGADGIMTDDPRRINSAFQDRRKK